MRLKKWAIVTLILLLAVMIAVAARSSRGRVFMAELLEHLAAFGVWGLVLIAVVYVPMCVLLIPGSVLTLGAGWLAGVLWPASPVLALIAGTAAISFGSTVGAALAFALGRTLLHDQVSRKLAQRPTLRGLNAAVGRQGLRVVFLVRLSPLFPFSIMNYALSLTQVSARDYLLASWVGMLPGTILYVYLGTTLSTLTMVAVGDATFPGASRIMFLGLGLAGTLVLVLWLGVHARKALLEVADTQQQEAP